MTKREQAAEQRRARFEPRKRTALDGRVWWCVWDTERGGWSTFLCHGKYITRKAAALAIEKGVTL